MTRARINDRMLEGRVRTPGRTHPEVAQVGDWYFNEELDEVLQLDESGHWLKVQLHWQVVEFARLSETLIETLDGRWLQVAGAVISGNTLLINLGEEVPRE